MLINETYYILLYVEVIIHACKNYIIYDSVLPIGGNQFLIFIESLKKFRFIWKVNKRSKTGVED